MQTINELYASQPKLPWDNIWEKIGKSLEQVESILLGYIVDGETEKSLRERLMRAPQDLIDSLWSLTNQILERNGISSKEVAWGYNLTKTGKQNQAQVIAKVFFKVKNYLQK